MTLHRGLGGSDPAGPDRVGQPSAAQEEQRLARTSHLGTGTLACPSCDAPLALAGRTATPADVLGCGYCGRTGPLRDFLSLAVPTRPARVAIRVVQRGRSAVRAPGGGAA